MSKAQKTRETLYDLQSEEGFISHVCNNPKILAEDHDVIDSLTAERKGLAEALYDLASQGEPLTDEALRVHGCSDRERDLFGKLAPITPPVSSRKLVVALREVAARREVATAASQAFSDATEGGSPALEPIEALEAATSRSRAILQGRSLSGGVSHIGELSELVEDIAWRAQNPNQIKGVPFGFHKLEGLIDGLQASKLYLLGARPSVGKTALAGDMVVNLARQGVGSIFFSCEMSDLQLKQRLLATLSGVNPTKSLSGALLKSELNDLRQGIATMKDWPVWIDDTDRINIDLLRSRARKAVSKDGVGCIIVDYIQLIKGVEPKSKMSKREEVGEVSGALKALSKELGVPVVALAQLRRTGNAYNSSSGATEIPKPNLESLKESGDLEQDADCVILLHRDMSKNASEACAIVAKNRSGACGEVSLSFANDTTSFSESPLVTT
ncbi:MAG: hypothetical protein CL699_06940 [Chloroflexi bacterium]|mgnify:CR=1 FL=1|nr:hypothetical protein [Chloroflexota bacterium]MAO75956.1 hypothetical protein [Chloroflexota bacterium]MAO76016.1 hypothetical protein [Chloroflexota bacterium]|tara:strand:+ start:3950 stop:5275 length:1326 start_codon:yes stop_codon:yes gene_type:complete